MIQGQPDFRGQGADLAGKITTAIAAEQRKQALGFLPDDARWRLLLNYIRNNPRFMLAIVWGNCTPDYLASAPEDEMHKRILTMNRQSHEDFAAQLRRSANEADPSVCLIILLSFLFLFLFFNFFFHITDLSRT